MPRTKADIPETEDQRSQHGSAQRPPNFPAPEDLAERVSKLLSELLTDQYAEEYGVKITVVTKRMAAERAKAASA